MTDTPPSLDLSALESDYEIVGELGTRGDARQFMATRRHTAAKRRDDDPRVLITVVSAPAGDEGNALAHLASDTNQLAHLSHRRLVPIIEGKWLGKDAYAIVSQRTNDASLAECIARGDGFSSPRVAAILREVNGVIDWARENQIVHRTVTTEGVFLEAKTDRVRVFFSAEPIHRIRPADVPEDARTIARLAMAMLTGNEDAQVCDAQTLAERRDDLPDQLSASACALLDAKSEATSKDVAAFVSLIGMADPLAAGESERERIRAEILEEQRVEREKIAAERANFEHHMASERATFDHQTAAERATFAHEIETVRNAFAKESTDARAAFAKEMTDVRAAFDREMADARAQHAAHKAELQRAAEAERASLQAQRAELERSVAAQRAELERVAALDREQVRRLRAQIIAAGELEVEKKRLTALDEITDEESALDDDALSVPTFMPPMISPLQNLAFDDESALMRDTAEALVPVVTPVNPEVGAAPFGGRRNWRYPAGIAAIVLLAVSLFVVRNRTSPIASGGDVAKAVAVPKAAPAPVVVAPVIDSAALLRAAAAESLRVADSVTAARERRAARRAAARRDSIARERRLDSLARIRDTLNP